VLGPDDIRRLCRLARLEITPAEMADVSAKLSSIVAMVDQLKAYACDGRHHRWRIRSSGRSDCGPTS
jgi:Asp-tRNA(Asn)/Glu-tRNA(Gln) amidotransferase C subunit